VPSPPGPPKGEFDFQRLRALWPQIQVETKQERFGPLAAMIEKAQLREGREAGRFTLAVDSDFHYKQLRETRRAQQFEALVGEVTGAPWRMNLELEAAPPGQGTAPAKTGGQSPRAAGGRGAAGAELREEPVVKKTIDLFKGKIV